MGDGSGWDHILLTMGTKENFNNKEKENLSKIMTAMCQSRERTRPSTFEEAIPGNPGGLGTVKPHVKHTLLLIARKSVKYTPN